MIISNMNKITAKLSIFQFFLLFAFVGGFAGVAFAFFLYWLAS